MELTPAQKSAGLLLLLDPVTRKTVLESFTSEERAILEDSLHQAVHRPREELQALIAEVCHDPLLKLPIVERDLEEWLSKRETAQEQSLIDRSTVTRILLRLDPRTLFYRK